MTPPGGRALPTGWFGFPHGEAAAGDVPAAVRVRRALDWSALLPADRAHPAELDGWWRWCLSAGARAGAPHRRAAAR
ncbi:hypothetical protein ACIQGZ_09105 [Streptomyces sp. NPDC092296]|uniref:hypothetical protein n=1 Tax=Streptomyces sp. NPDC092296 TaxID=3366012 RepID=UPI003816F1F2